MDDLTTELSQIGPISGRRFSIRVVSGASTGVVTEIEAGLPVLVGTSEVCALRLNDRLVSRRHLELEVTGAGLRVRDLDSTNGVTIDGLRVLEAFVRGGERIVLGDSTLLAEAGAEAPARAPVTASGFGRLLGGSPAMRALYPLFDRLARSDVPLLIEGETGTGKEVAAEAIHEASARAKGPFVVFDCTMVASNLLESELFGHARGAFTGAVNARAGVFEQAHGGTLLIDEIGDLGLAMQPKLLRAIERSEVKRLGDEKSFKVDVRILAATRRNLDNEIQRGRFRDDLFHRLAVARIELPPLRRRREDIGLLARHFAALSGAAASALPYEQLVKWESAPWSGNVRELRNAVVRFLALGDGSIRDYPSAGAVTTGSFSEWLRLPIGVARQRLLDAFERAYVEHVLAEHDGNIERAAAASGIARRQFFRLKAKASSG